ncbi:putative uncharacterized protein DDB_G0284715 [Littorina saxatilis]|uniref:putative uncharacterized protein DDB_G0284715 n=1 Tax=Littorina saxatilis TaxID=31220 RepID=UPI0038B510BC
MAIHEVGQYIARTTISCINFSLVFALNIQLTASQRAMSSANRDNEASLRFSVNKNSNTNINNDDDDTDNNNNNDNTNNDIGNNKTKNDDDNTYDKYNNRNSNDNTSRDDDDGADNEVKNTDTAHVGNTNSFTSKKPDNDQR